MPRGPNGQRRPADGVGCAVMTARVAIGEVTEDLREPSGRVRSGQAGGKARAEKMTREERVDVARKAASARWT